MSTCTCTEHVNRIGGDAVEADLDAVMALLESCRKDVAS
jgi:hypothetical protein